MNIELEPTPKKPPKKSNEDEPIVPMFFNPDQAERFVKSMEAIATALASWQHQQFFK